MTPYTKEACLDAAECFLRILPTSAEPELMQLCADGLYEVAQNFDQYQSYISTATPFMREISDSVQELCAENQNNAEQQQDKAFMLLEALVIIMREVILRGNIAQPSPAQKALMRYFEESGHWKMGEGTLVTDYYYARIPIAVMHSLVEALQMHAQLLRPN